MKRILVLLGVTASLWAQQPGLPGAVDPVTGLPLMARDTGPKFNLDFPGGNPELLVEVIQSDSKKRPNVVIHPEFKNKVLPPFKLREVTAAQVFETLNTLGHPTYEMGYWKQVPTMDSVIWTLSRMEYAAFGAPGFQPGQAVAAPVQKLCRVYNVGPYLDTFKVEDITTAVQGAWELMEAEPKPSIKYHKDTKLLIVVGAQEQLNVLNEVLMQLRTSIPSKPEVASGPGPIDPVTGLPTATPKPKLQ